MASTKGERQAVDAAAAIMAEEAFRLGVTHAGFAMTSLPHKRIVDPVWRREGAMTTLLVEAGRNEVGASMGVPYGSFARLVLLYLQTEAIRTGSPEVELGRSMNAWLGRMSLEAKLIGGRRASEAHISLPPNVLHRSGRRTAPAKRRIRTGCDQSVWRDERGATVVVARQSKA
jgi:hypothetical protein